MTAGNEPQGMPLEQWDKWVSAAYLRMLGATQSEAAEAVGRKERTIRSWESDSRWPQAMADARERWLSGVEGAARATLLACVRDPKKGDLALKVLERLDHALSPHQVTVAPEDEVRMIVFAPDGTVLPDWVKEKE